MNEALIYSEGLISGSRTIADHWGPAWLAETTQAEDLSALTATSPAPSPPSPIADHVADPFTTPAELVTYSEACWSEVYPHDRRFLMAPRSHPAPCPWCGGRLVHNRLCDELRSSWQPTMPFGKHKGKPLHGVPGDYLHWVLAGDYAAPELRAHVEAEIKQRKETTQ